jgi:hypothetical protein|nr:MAG TPA: hypothetical protein [Bacteriophage sp.]
MIIVKTIIVNLLKKEWLSSFSKYSTFNQYKEIINKCLLDIDDDNFIEEIRIYSSIIKILVSNYDRTHLFFISCGVNNQNIDIIEIY